MSVQAHPIRRISATTTETLRKKLARPGHSKISPFHLSMTEEIGYNYLKATTKHHHRQRIPRSVSLSTAIGCKSGAYLFRKQLAQNFLSIETDCHYAGIYHVFQHRSYSSLRNYNRLSAAHHLSATIVIIISVEKW